MTTQTARSFALRLGACVGLSLGSLAPSAAIAATPPDPATVRCDQSTTDPPLAANEVIGEQVTSPAGTTWAVGQTTITTDAGATITRPLIFRHSGCRWSRERLPNLPDLANGPVVDVRLVGVTVASDEGVWAIWMANAATSTAIKTPVVLHRVGPRWKVMPPPYLPADYEYLSGIWTYRALAGNRIWVAGTRMPSNSHFAGLLSLWDGTAWIDHHAEVSGTILNSMVGLSDTDIWVTGLHKESISNLDPGHVTLAHFTGTNWADSPVPTSSGIFGLARYANLYISDGVVHLKGTSQTNQPLDYTLG